MKLKRFTNHKAPKTRNERSIHQGRAIMILVSAGNAATISHASVQVADGAGVTLTGADDVVTAGRGTRLSIIGSRADVTAGAASTAGAGNIVKDGFPFLHNYGGVNTFVGQSTGNFSLTGNFNTATGQGALNSITTGSKNTASGASALTLTNSGSRNAAFGVNALGNNSAGNDNTAIGTEAMLFNATGSANSAYGVGALSNNQTGSNNTAVGFQALSSPLSGTNNIGIGYQAGSNISGASSNNIYIGSSGNVGESNTIQIGTSGTHTATFISGIFNTSANGIAAYINAAGRFGTVFSSARYKDEIADMGNTSAGLMALRPVTFRYKPEHDDGARLLQYGLVAEEVAEVYPELVLMTAEGKAQTVRYQFLPPMLLNEFQKQQRTIVAQATELALQRGRMELLERELRNIKALLGVK